MIAIICSVLSGIVGFVLASTEAAGTFKAGWDDGYSAGIREAYERMRAAKSE